MMTGIIVVSYHNAEGTRKYVVKQLSKLSDAYRVIVVAVDATKQNEISSLRSDRKETNRNKSYWEGQKKEAEAALEAMYISLRLVI